jgi:hypothetical protein
VSRQPGPATLAAVSRGHALLRTSRTSLRRSSRPRPAQARGLRVPGASRGPALTSTRAVTPSAEPLPQRPTPTSLPGGTKLCAARTERRRERLEAEVEVVSVACGNRSPRPTTQDCRSRVGKESPESREPRGNAIPVLEGRTPRPPCAYRASARPAHRVRPGGKYAPPTASEQEARTPRLSPGSLRGGAVVPGVRTRRCPQAGRGAELLPKAVSRCFPSPSC